MGSGDEGTQDRTLRLSRETLRDLAPTERDAAAVRGGGDVSYMGRSAETCEPPMYEAIRAMLGQTSLTLGCTGTVKLTPSGDGGHEISFNIEPTAEMRELQARMLRHLDK